MPVTRIGPQCSACKREGTVPARGVYADGLCSQHYRLLGAFSGIPELETSTDMSAFERALEAA